jgi:hypothetical protein
LILQSVFQDSENTELGSKAARLALTYLRRINRERFGREREILLADIELSNWLREH